MGWLQIELIRNDKSFQIAKNVIIVSCKYGKIITFLVDPSINDNEKNSFTTQP